MSAKHFSDWDPDAPVEAATSCGQRRLRRLLKRRHLSKVELVELAELRASQPDRVNAGLQTAKLQPPEAAANDKLKNSRPATPGFS